MAGKPKIKHYAIFLKEVGDRLVLESILRHEKFNFSVQTVHGMGDFDGWELIQLYATKANFEEYVMRELDGPRFEGRVFEVHELG